MNIKLAAYLRDTNMISFHNINIFLFFLKIELKTSKKRYALLRSKIKQSEITPAHLENMYYILHHVLQHSKVSHSWENDLQQVANDVTMQVSNNKPGKAQKWRSIINREELKKSIIERGNSLSKTHEMSLDVLIHINLFIGTFTKTTQYSLETIKPDGLYVQGHEQKSYSPDCAGRAVGNFLITVFALLGYDMHKATISTDMVFVNEEMFEKALKRRWPIPPKLNVTTPDGNRFWVFKNRFSRGYYRSEFPLSHFIDSTLHEYFKRYY